MKTTDMLDDIVNIKKQIAQLETMLATKKKSLANYFESTGLTQESNGKATAYVQTKTTIDYDIAKLQQRLTKEQKNQVISKEYKINQPKEFLKLLSTYGLKDEAIKFISVEKSVNKEALNTLYEHGDINLSDLDGCYTAKVTKTIAIRINE